MPKRTTAQKKARALQAETGRPYRSCLQEVLDAQAERDALPAPADEPELELDSLPDFAPPTSGGLFSHT